MINSLIWALSKMIKINIPIKIGTVIREIPATKFNGILETATKPFDAQPRLLSKLLVLFPNILSGLLYLTPTLFPPK